MAQTLIQVDAGGGDGDVDRRREFKQTANCESVIGG